MKTVLIQYKGGGYSGCFWEWNYCLIQEGKFHDIYSSGRNGATTLDELRERLKDPYAERFTYQLPKQWDEFVSESHPQDVFGVAQYLNKDCGINDMDYPLECPECKQEKDMDDLMLHPDDYSGNGGIGVQFHSWICHECYSNQSCSHCGSHVGNDDNPDWAHNQEDAHLLEDNESIKKFDENYGPLCQWCFEKAKEDTNIQEHIDTMAGWRDKWLSSGFGVPGSLKSDNWHNNKSFA